MDMVRHQHPSVTAGFGFCNNSTKARNKIVPIGTVFKDRFALYSADDDMMQATWGIYSGFTGHSACLLDLINCLNRKIERTSPLSWLFVHK